MTARRHIRADEGQSTVELVALLPLILLVAVAGFILLSARTAADRAAAAAQAGAMALLQDGDPKEAARESLPAAARDRASIQVEGRRVRVTVRPRVPMPQLERVLTASSVADAGPEASR
jgi:hypothetical protein